LAYGSLPPILAVRIMLFRLRLLLQLIEQLPACRGRQRQYPRRYRHHLVVERTMAKVSGHVGLNSRVYRVNEAQLKTKTAVIIASEKVMAPALWPLNPQVVQGGFRIFASQSALAYARGGWAIKNERRRSNLSFEDCMHRGKCALRKKSKNPKPR
jgi:hypothetical protein